MMDENTTRNFYLAAVYMTLGAQYEKMTSDDPNNLGRKTFHFLPKEELDFAQTKKDFANGTLMINAARYADCLRNLKSILHGSE
jgi:hypothetical protein